MSERSIKIPGPEHPIKILSNHSRIVVALGGRKIAETRSALFMEEAMYPRIVYISRANVDMQLLERSTHTTYCPYKGDCSYYSLPAGGERGINAVWTYEAPFDWMDAIKGLLAFYPDRVDITEHRI